MSQCLASNIIIAGMLPLAYYGGKLVKREEETEA